MDFLIFLLIAFGVIRKLKAGSEKEKSGESSARRKMVSQSDERRAEEAKEASRRQTRYSYEYNHSETLRKTGNPAAEKRRAMMQQALKRAKQVAAEALIPEGEGTAKPGSLSDFQAEIQGTCPPEHQHGGPGSAARDPDREGSLGLPSNLTAEGSCEPGHQHGGVVSLTNEVKRPQGTAKRRTAAETAKGDAGKRRFSDNEVVNGVIWGEVLRRPGERRASRMR